MSISTNNRAKVDASTITYVTHVVDVDLSALLAGLEVQFADTVVLTIQTPSGRAKRVTLNPSFLVPQHHVEDYEYPRSL